MNTQDERKAFESAYSKAHKIYPSTLKKYADGSYYNGAVRAAFRWWIESAKRAEEKLEGCVVVPVDPTDSMYVAFEKGRLMSCSVGGFKDFKDGYKELIKAAMEKKDD